MIRLTNSTTAQIERRGKELVAEIDQDERIPLMKYTAHLVETSDIKNFPELKAKDDLGILQIMDPK